MGGSKASNCSSTLTPKAPDMRLSTHSAHNAARRGGEFGITVSAQSRAGRCALKCDAAMKHFAFGGMRTAECQRIYRILSAPCRISSVIQVLVEGMTVNTIVVAQRARQVDDAALKPAVRPATSGSVTT
jgi:hypothetical protein